MTKKTFSLNLLVLSLSLFFFNCQLDENNLVHKKHIDSNVKEERGNFNSFNLSQITNRLRIFEKSLNYRSTEDNFTFYIDTTNILKLKNEFSETYTLKVNNENTPENSFQNIVLVSQPNKNPRAFLYTYFPDDSFKSNILTNINTPFSGRTTVVELDYTRINLQEEVTCVTTTQTLCDYHYTHVAGERCTNVYQSTSTICLDSGGGSDSGSTIGVGDYGGDYGIGGGTYYGDGGGYNPFLGILTRPEIPYIDNSDILGDVNNAKFNFLLANLNLNGPQIRWLGTDIHKIIPLYNYLYNNNTIEGVTFVKQLIQNSILTGLTFDVELSAKSPANIDFSDIDVSTPEGEHFNWIYSKLMETSDFKELFNNTFGGNQTKLNVKFEFADDLPAGTYGTCRLQIRNGNYTNLIRINRSKILTSSNLSIAKTIFHEGIHAYLNIKNINQNLGSSITALNGMDLKDVIGTFYQGFGGILVNGSNQTQHAFIFDHLVPVLENTLADLKDDLISPYHINQMETNPNSYFYNSVTNMEEPFNWNDLFHFLSLTGLQNSTPFQTMYPNGSLGYQKWDHYGVYIGINSLTRTQF